MEIAIPFIEALTSGAGLPTALLSGFMGWHVFDKRKRTRMDYHREDNHVTKVQKLGVDSIVQKSFLIAIYDAIAKKDAVSGKELYDSIQSQTEALAKEITENTNYAK